MAAFHPSPLYPIVDVSHGETARSLEVAEGVLRAGVAWLQLRVKETPTGEHLALARDLVARAARTGARVIVNDRLDVALSSGAAGVHLGQTDLPLAAARQATREHGLVVGVSTHDLAQAREAEAGGADYIGFGPMFSTSSKANALEPRSDGTLAAVRAAVELPIVAIGGIEAHSAGDVLRQGADAVAMIGALVRAKDVEGLAREVLALDYSS